MVCIGDPRMFSDGLRSLDRPFLDGNMFRKVTMSFTSDIVINFVEFLYGTEWQPHITHSFIVCISLMCLFEAHVFRCAGD